MAAQEGRQRSQVARPGPGSQAPPGAGDEPPLARPRGQGRCQQPPSSPTRRERNYRTRGYRVPLLPHARGAPRVVPGRCARVDVDAFERSARDARRSGRPEEYRAALDLYSGDLLPRDRYEEWTEARREDLRRTHLALLFELANILEDRGQLEGAVEALQEIVSQKPGHEEAHVGLMRVYARAGQRHRAIRQYVHLCQALRLEDQRHQRGRQAHRLGRRERTDRGRMPRCSRRRRRHGHSQVQRRNQRQRFAQRRSRHGQLHHRRHRTLDAELPLTWSRVRDTPQPTGVAKP